MEFVGYYSMDKLPKGEYVILDKKNIVNCGKPECKCQGKELINSKDVLTPSESPFLTSSDDNSLHEDNDNDFHICSVSSDTDNYDHFNKQIENLSSMNKESNQNQLFNVIQETRKSQIIPKNPKIKNLTVETEPFNYKRADTKKIGKRKIEPINCNYSKTDLKKSLKIKDSRSLAVKSTNTSKDKINKKFSKSDPVKHNLDINLNIDEIKVKSVKKLTKSQKQYSKEDY